MGFLIRVPQVGGPPIQLHIFRTRLVETMRMASESWLAMQTARLRITRQEWNQLSPHWRVWSISPLSSLPSTPLSRAYRTTAIMSPSAKAHAWFDDPHICPLCGAQDSIPHLLLECPELNDLRVNLDVPTPFSKLPRATLLTGLPSMLILKKIFHISNMLLLGTKSSNSHKCTSLPFRPPAINTGCCRVRSSLLLEGRHLQY